jgi:hypothetical protein
MMRARPILALMLASLTLQGCVALALPVVAAGVIGKGQIDKARARTEAAEASFDPRVGETALIGQVVVGDPAAAPANGSTISDAVSAPAQPDAAGALGAANALARLDEASITNAYLPFARYAIGEAAKRQAGGRAKGAVLTQNVSLTQPLAIDCGNKPLAAIIDLDIAPGTPAEMEVERQNGFAALLDAMRESDIRIAWLAETSEGRLGRVLGLLREGDEPVMRAGDIMLVGLPGSYRKQEHRWQLAQSHCVIAIAGDRKSDFDELYDFLRDQSYAIRLEAFMGRGWFELPHPVTAIDSERLELQPDQKAE